MTGPRRGGLGRGLGALIPSAPAAGDDAKTRADSGDVMSPSERKTRGRTAGKASLTPGAASGAGTRAGNRVPSVAAIAASSATDFYFDPSPVPGATLRELKIAEIKTNPKQPRLVFDEEALEELAHSIREFGVLQPIVVRETAAGYELVMGERRLRASAVAGLERIPAIVRDTADSAMLRDALLENIHRAQLNPLEEAAAYQQLLEEFGVTHDELATRIGRSRSQVSNTIRLMNLSIPVQRRVAAGVLSAGHARALLALPNKDEQDDLAARIVAEGLSVRATEELVAVTVGRPGQRKKTLKPVKTLESDDLGSVSEQLSEALDTTVKVSTGLRKGKISIEFGSVEDLRRIVELIVAPSRAKGR